MASVLYSRPTAVASAPLRAARSAAQVRRCVFLPATYNPQQATKLTAFGVQPLSGACSLVRRPVAVHAGVAPRRPLVTKTQSRPASQRGPLPVGGRRAGPTYQEVSFARMFLTSGSALDMCYRLVATSAMVCAAIWACQNVALVGRRCRSPARCPHIRCRRLPHIVLCCSASLRRHGTSRGSVCPASLLHLSPPPAAGSPQFYAHPVELALASISFVYVIATIILRTMQEYEAPPRPASQPARAPARERGALFDFLGDFLEGVSDFSSQINIAFDTSSFESSSGSGGSHHHGSGFDFDTSHHHASSFDTSSFDCGSSGADSCGCD